MNAIRYVAKLVFRFAVLWTVDAISLGVAATILPGVNITGGAPIAFAAVLMLSIINFLIRPLILLLALPLGSFAALGMGLIFNALALLIASNLLPDFEVSNFFSAFLGGLVFALVNTVITGAMTVDDENSFYEGLVGRLARRQTFKGASEPGRGLVMMEIDGLSYHHIREAIAAGYMPTLKRMRDREGYVLSQVDCGLPSQTSACQAGIMFGDNYDIPSFRWYDKDLQKLFVSGKDAALLNQRYAKGQGLMRGGSSINNLLNGDAEKSILTMADLATDDQAEQWRRAEDIYLLMLHPYFVMRTVVLFLGEMLREVWEYGQDKWRNVQPRLNRLRHYYPAVRATTTILMRDIAAYLTILDILRGSPAIYVTWPGYDEVAHHTGPWTEAAFRTLNHYDRIIARVKDFVEHKAPRPYELIILSDHGQSFGPTFLQRYGYTLKEFIERNLPAGTTIAHTAGGDDGTVSVAAMASELQNIQQQRLGNAAGRAMVKQARRVADRSIERQAPLEWVQPAQVTVCGSGNIAQVYFDLYPRKIKLGELNAAYPDMVAALVQHEGVGFVVAYDDAGAPIVLGKQGQRQLHTGAVSGEDPLKPYGDPELRAQQVRRVADFPHAGDLIVNSTLYPDGTVAAMEELIGSHGGLGGEQTDAFLFHPADMRVPPTTNSAEVYQILNARRGAPVIEKPKKIEISQVDAWATARLGKGLGQGSQWLGLAIRSLVLDREAFKEVARDVDMTGPSVLIGVVMTLLSSVVRSFGFRLDSFVTALATWLVTVLTIFGAARVLGGKASYTRTLRTIGFAQTAHVFDLLVLIPAAAPLARIATLVMSFFATWIGAVEAHALRGWRTIILPLAAVVLLIVGVVVLQVLLQGAVFTLEALARELGLRPY